MAPVIPDCGIFSTPRREPPLRVLAEGVEQQPTQHGPATPSLSQLSLSSPRDALKASDIPTTSGISLSFFKSPTAPPKTYKSPKETLRRPAVPKVQKRRKGGEINKGVGHGIKKPKAKVIEEKKKKQKVEEAAKRLKAREPRLPANRSPVKSTPVQQKVVTDESFLPEASNGKFFTSRSRAAATVQISKNIKLSAKYGDMSLNQKSRGFAKKNIGRHLEEKLDQYLQQSRFMKGISEALPLASVPNTPRPAPTRVPSSPSPTKKVTKGRKWAPSPRKTGSTSAIQKQSNASGGEELQDMESIMKEWDLDEKVEGRRTSPRKQQTSSISSSSNVSHKHTGLSTPTRRSPRKMMRSVCESPVRKSPRKMMSSSCASPVRQSPRRVKGNSCASPLRTSPRKAMSNSCGSPVHKSPRKLVAESHTPLKNTPQKHQEETASPSKFSRAHQAVLEDVSASPRRKSPRKLDSSTTKKVLEKEKQEAVAPEAMSKEVKYFPIFYPNTRLSECIFPKDRNGRSNKKTALKDDDTQLMIDAGQKEFGVRHCPSCGLVFEVGNTTDETSHKEYHDHLFTALKHNGWKKETLARELDHRGGRVLVVSGQDPQHWWQKVEEVRKVVDNELGFSENSIRTQENTKVFMYVLDRQVVGCLIAEKIDKAYRVVPQKPQKEGSNRLVCCSQAPTKVWVGVSRVWVLQAHRGRGIATTLVDAMRNNMIKSHILSVDQFAFSDPTEVGLSFAEKYTGRPDFLVYRREY